MKQTQINSISLKLCDLHHKYEFMPFEQLSQIGNRKHDLNELEREIYERIFSARKSFYDAQMQLFKTCPDFLIQSCGSESYLTIASNYGLAPTDTAVNHV
ncbi:MAG: hypothetical protein ABL920_09865 [Methylotenera sp.]